MRVLIAGLALIAGAGFGVALPVAGAGARAAEPSGSPQDAQRAIEAGRRALSRQADFPWYDAAQDGLRRFDVQPPKDLKNRQSRWQTTPPKNVRMPSWLWTLLEVLGWTLLVAAITLLVVALVRAYLLDASGSATEADTAVAETAKRGDADRVESLPFALRAAQSDLLEEARRCYESGDYGQAIVYLYSYQLVQLDKCQCIRLAKGKTNRQYLRELRLQPALFRLLEKTMVAFEDVFFGRHTLDRGRFESCWDGVGQFHQLLEHGVS